MLFCVFYFSLTILPLMITDARGLENVGSVVKLGCRELVCRALQTEHYFSKERDDSAWWPIKLAEGWQ